MKCQTLLVERIVKPVKTVSPSAEQPLKARNKSDFSFIDLCRNGSSFVKKVVRCQTNLVDWWIARDSSPFCDKAELRCKPPQLYIGTRVNAQSLLEQRV